MSSEGSFQNEVAKYLECTSDKHSSDFPEGPLAKKCLSALLFTAKKCVASMKFSLFRETFIEIHQSHPGGLKEIHKQLQVQMVDRLKGIMLKLFIKHDISSRLSLLDKTIMDNKNAWNKANKSDCPLILKSTNCSSHPPNKVLISLKNQRMSRSESLGVKQAIKRSKPTTCVERPGQSKSSSTKQAHLKHSTYIRNKYKKMYWKSSSQAKFYWEKLRLNSVLSKLHSYNEEKEDMIFRVHEDILSLGNRIQDLNDKLMVELDTLHERHFQTK